MGIPLSSSRGGRLLTWLLFATFVGIVFGGFGGRVMIALVVEVILAAIFIPLVVTAGPSAPRSLQLRGEVLGGMVVLAVLAALGLFGLCASVAQYERAGELVSSGRVAQATITGVYSKSGNGGHYANYTFTVNGSVFQGKADYHGGFGDRGPISVTYLPADPTFSAIRPTAAQSDARFGVFFMLAWLALLTFFSCAIFYGSRRSQRS